MTHLKAILFFIILVIPLFAFPKKKVKKISFTFCDYEMINGKKKLVKSPSGSITFNIAGLPIELVRYGRSISDRILDKDSVLSTSCGVNNHKIGRIDSIYYSPAGLKLKVRSIEFSETNGEVSFQTSDSVFTYPANGSTYIKTNRFNEREIRRSLLYTKTGLIDVQTDSIFESGKLYIVSAESYFYDYKGRIRKIQYSSNEELWKVDSFAYSSEYSADSSVSKYEAGTLKEFIVFKRIKDKHKYPGVQKSIEFYIDYYWDYFVERNSYYDKNNLLMKSISRRFDEIVAYTLYKYQFY